MKKVSIIGSEEKFSVPKIICIGQNYAAHAREMNFEVPTSPVFFLKPSSAIIENGETVIIPKISQDVHHEVELTVLIGTGGKNIPREMALQHVAGYGVGLDMTMRDVQLEAKKKGLPWALAKGFDTSAPLSVFVPVKDVENPLQLILELRVNGILRQTGRISELIFPVEHLISYISQYITFEPGDVIYTGTPEGVASVKPGDILTASLLKADGTLLTSLQVGVN